MLRIDVIYAFGVIGTRDCGKFLNYLAKHDIIQAKSGIMAKNYFITYSEQLATYDVALNWNEY